jgi:hypothetical protein
LSLVVGGLDPELNPAGRDAVAQHDVEAALSAWHRGRSGLKPRNTHGWTPHESDWVTANDVFTTLESRRFPFWSKIRSTAATKCWPNGRGGIGKSRA